MVISLGVCYILQHIIIYGRAVLIVLSMPERREEKKQLEDKQFNSCERSWNLLKHIAIAVSIASLN